MLFLTCETSLTRPFVQQHVLNMSVLSTKRPHNIKQCTFSISFFSCKTPAACYSDHNALWPYCLLAAKTSKGCPLLCKTSLNLSFLFATHLNTLSLPCKVLSTSSFPYKMSSECTFLAQCVLNMFLVCEMLHSMTILEYVCHNMTFLSDKTLLTCNL